MKKIECFKIQVTVADNPLDLKNGKIIKRILNDNTFSLKEPTIIEADPFLFEYRGRLFLFYEHKKLNHNGVICMISTRDLVTWTEPIVVLSEKCHLSYPFVFENDGSVYMIPETCELREIRLYKASNDLSSFHYVKTILKDEVERVNGFSFSDTSILKNGNKYYLMTTVNENNTNILKLYVSDDFGQGYVEHPNSPVNVGNKYGRNAGCVLELDGELYRVAQDCVDRYGDNIHILKINILNEKKFDEYCLKDDVIPIEKTFYKNGGHQLNFIRFNDQYIVASDAKEYNLFSIYKLIKKCLKGNDIWK